MYSPTLSGERALKASFNRLVKLAIYKNHWKLKFQERCRVDPLAFFFLEFPALIHKNLPVVSETDRVSLQRPRCRAFEVHVGDVVTAAVAGAFEFLFGLQPVRRAAEVRTDCRKRVNTAGIRPLVIRCANEPDGEFLFETLVNL